MNRKRKNLTPDDNHLWDRVKQSAIPMHALSDKPQFDKTEDKKQQRAILNPISSDQPASQSLKSAQTKPRLSNLDRRTNRRLKRGRAHIDAKLDLHGQTQGSAHQALRSFLYSSQRKGAGFVLIVTGKSGVLNRLVPLWLSEPTMRTHISAISPASPRHGGQGALYVRLKRQG